MEINITEQDKDQMAEPTMTLSKDDLARELRVSERTIDRLLKAGELPQPFRVGAQVRWMRAGLEAFLRAKTDLRAKTEAANKRLGKSIKDSV